MRQLSRWQGLLLARRLWKGRLELIMTIVNGLELSSTVPAQYLAIVSSVVGDCLGAWNVPDGASLIVCTDIYPKRKDIVWFSREGCKTTFCKEFVSRLEGGGIQVRTRHIDPARDQQGTIPDNALLGVVIACIKDDVLLWEHPVDYVQRKQDDAMRLSRPASNVICPLAWQDKEAVWP